MQGTAGSYLQAGEAGTQLLVVLEVIFSMIEICGVIVCVCVLLFLRMRFGFGVWLLLFTPL